MNENYNGIQIRMNINPGDLGFVIHIHGMLYSREYNYGTEFEMYVAEGLSEFYKFYKKGLAEAWICEKDSEIIGALFFMERENKSAQLRYFLIDPRFRNLGLGKKLMTLFEETLLRRRISYCYLWTTSDLPAAASLYTRFGYIKTDEIESENFGRKVLEQKYEKYI